MILQCQPPDAHTRACPALNKTLSLSCTLFVNKERKKKEKRNVRKGKTGDRGLHEQYSKYARQRNAGIYFPIDVKKKRNTPT